jgi:hypothetical protein
MRSNSFSDKSNFVKFVNCRKIGRDLAKCADLISKVRRDTISISSGKVKVEIPLRVSMDRGPVCEGNWKVLSPLSLKYSLQLDEQLPDGQIPE